MGKSITPEVMEIRRIVGEGKAMELHQSAIGPMLRDWRGRRRLSQLDLALSAEISARHMSFIETGRSRPSRDVVLRLADSLGLDLRNRNALLMAAGYAPGNAERRFDDPSLAPARAVVQRILDAHMPFPALAVDRHWNMIASNPAVAKLLAGVSAKLLEPPVNVLRLSLHPEGLANRITNLAEWKRHLLERLEQQFQASGDQLLAELAEELRGYPTPASSGPPQEISAIAVPLILSSEAGLLSFLSTTTVFGTPVEVTLSELAIESFFPADQATGDRLRQLAGAL